MKRSLLLGVSLLMAAGGLKAQFDEVKTFLMLNQFAKAKEKVDEIEKKGKATAKPEFHMAKASVLAGMAREAQGEQATQYLGASIAAYKKFLEVDPENKSNLIQDQAYAATPFTYYSTLFNRGIAEFNDKKYDVAANTFRNTIEWSDFLIKYKQINLAFDTNAHSLAGAASQNAEKVDDALMYYGKMAERKIGGKEYLDMYKYMTYEYFLRNDMAAFEKSKVVGKELYPNEQFFTFEVLEFILDMEDEDKKLARLEELVGKSPDNAKVQQVYGNILFEKLNDRDANLSAPEYPAQEEKMMQALAKAAAAMPEDGSLPFFMGKHQWYKADRIRNDISDVNDAIRKFNDAQKPDKAGKLPPPPKDLTAKRDSLRKMQEGFMDKAVPFLLKAQPLMEKTYTKSKSETQNYKILIDDLIQYYGFKRQYSKTPAEKTKADAEEKKWDKVYSEIKQ